MTVKFSVSAGRMCRLAAGLCIRPARLYGLRGRMKKTAFLIILSPECIVHYYKVGF